MLPRMTVGMLACHLGGQLVRARDILPIKATGHPLDAADDHYGKAAWVSAESLEDPAMDRTLDGREAMAGFEALHSRAAQALADVQTDPDLRPSRGCRDHFPGRAGASKGETSC